MHLHIPAFSLGTMIPHEYCFMRTDSEHNITASDNINPEIIWNNLPDNTQSCALLMTNHETPADYQVANKDHIIIQHNVKRDTFFHWVVVDIPPSCSMIKKGEASSQHIKKGKKNQQNHFGLQGVNDYTLWFNSLNDTDMMGEYYGYDGPAPPFNDEHIFYTYVFTLYALDCKSLGLSGSFTGHDALTLIQHHKIAAASWNGIYTTHAEHI